MRHAWLALLLAAACGKGRPDPKAEAPPAPAPDPAVPDHVVYDQILIAFKGSYKTADTDRPREAARELAAKVFDLARSGSDFGALKREYTDARDKDGEPFGTIHVARDGVRKAPYEIYRSTLYPGPSAVIFGLRTGDVGMAEHDPKRCPEGWLVIKRIE